MTRERHGLLVPGQRGSAPHRRGTFTRKFTDALSAPGPTGVDVGPDAQVPPHGQRVWHVRVQLRPQLARREAPRPDVTLPGNSGMSLVAALFISV